VNAVLERARVEHGRFVIQPARTCQLCTHGVDIGGARCCAHQAVTGGNRPPQPWNLARLRGGACGPDACLLHLPTWGHQ
jgi:hypothetical protein